MRKPPRDLHIAYAERLSQLDGNAWRTLTADAGVFMQAPFLTAFERALADNVSPRYALLYQAHEPVAALSLQLVHLHGASAVRPNTLKGPMHGVAQLVDERALVLGHLAAWGTTGLVIRDGADAAVVWREALALVDRIRRFEKLEGSINVAAIKDAGDERGDELLRASGYRRVPAGPNMVLALEPTWATFDDYLESLTANARRAIKKTRTAVEAAGYCVRDLDEAAVTQHQRRLEALYGEVWASADVRPLRLPGVFFAELKQRLGADCSVTVLERAGSLDGFVVCLESGATCVGYYLGYDKGLDVPLYLRLLIRVVEQAIAWGCTSVSMGRTAEEPKARLGAVAGPSSLWVRHRVAPLNWAMGAALGAMVEPEVPRHRVFRGSSAG